MTATFRPIAEPMIRVGALGYTLGRNPEDLPYNINPQKSLWNAPDGRELTYTAAQEECRWIQSFLVYYLVSGRYVLANVFEEDHVRKAVFGSKEEALLFVQDTIISRQHASRQFLIEGPGADYHITNDAEGLASMAHHLPHQLRKKF